MKDGDEQRVEVEGKLELRHSASHLGPATLAHLFTLGPEKNNGNILAGYHQNTPQTTPYCFQSDLY